MGCEGPNPHRIGTTWPGLENSRVMVKGKAVKHTPPLIEACLGMGSGQTGYNSITIREDGSVEVVKEMNSALFHRFRGKIDPFQARNFLDSPKFAVLEKLRRSYVAKDINDGSQGFLFLRSQSALSFTYFDNYYPYDFRGLWKQAEEIVASQPSSRWSKWQPDDGHTETHAREKAAKAALK